MQKTLTKHGNSYALVIDKPILDLLRVTPETLFEIMSDGQCLVLTPIREPKEEEKFQQALASLHKRFGRAMKKLAEVSLSMAQPWFLDHDHAIRLHRSLLDSYGGIDGIRDAGLLHSALAVPQATFDGEFLHRDLYEMAGAYLYHIVQNHPFLDGNKRTGAAAAIIFLAMNEIELVADEESLVELVLQVACGTVGKPEIVAYLRHHVRSVGSTDSD